MPRICPEWPLQRVGRAKVGSVRWASIAKASQLANVGTSWEPISIAWATASRLGGLDARLKLQQVTDRALLYPIRLPSDRSILARYRDYYAAFFALPDTGANCDRHFIFHCFFVRHVTFQPSRVEIGRRRTHRVSCITAGVQRIEVALHLVVHLEIKWHYLRFTFRAGDSRRVVRARPYIVHTQPPLCGVRPRPNPLRGEWSDWVRPTEICERLFRVARDKARLSVRASDTHDLRHYGRCYERSRAERRLEAPQCNEDSITDHRDPEPRDVSSIRIDGRCRGSRRYLEQSEVTFKASASRSLQRDIGEHSHAGSQWRRRICDAESCSSQRNRSSERRCRRYECRRITECCDAGGGTIIVATHKAHESSHVIAFTQTVRASEAVGQVIPTRSLRTGQSPPRRCCSRQPSALRALRTTVRIYRYSATAPIRPETISAGGCAREGARLWNVEDFHYVCLSFGFTDNVAGLAASMPLRHIYARTILQIQGVWREWHDICCSRGGYDGTEAAGKQEVCQMQVGMNVADSKKCAN